MVLPPLKTQARAARDAVASLLPAPPPPPPPFPLALALARTRPRATSLVTQVARLRAHLTDVAWLPRDYPDPFGRSASVMPWDRSACDGAPCGHVLDDARAYDAGLSDDAGGGNPLCPAPHASRPAPRARRCLAASSVTRRLGSPAQVSRRDGARAALAARRGAARRVHRVDPLRRQAGHGQTAAQVAAAASRGRRCHRWRADDDGALLWGSTPGVQQRSEPTCHSHASGQRTLRQFYYGPNLTANSSGHFAWQYTEQDKCHKPFGGPTWCMTENSPPHMGSNPRRPLLRSSPVPHVLAPLHRGQWPTRRTAASTTRTTRPRGTSPTTPIRTFLGCHFGQLVCTPTHPPF